MDYIQIIHICHITFIGNQIYSDTLEMMLDRLYGENNTSSMLKRYMQFLLWTTCKILWWYSVSMTSGLDRFRCLLIFNILET